jgi:predicted acylesterase/phospholipase RssA
MADPERRGDALVLGGAVAKGAFAAAAVAELMKRERFDLRRIVGASSGALSGAFLSACPDRADDLVSLWLDEASWRVFTPDPTLRGLSSQRRLQALVERALPRTPGPGVPLRIVVADAAGAPGSIGGSPATTFERVFRFDAPRFTNGSRAMIVEAVLASAAFPLLFPTRGALLDGGIVQNTPVKLALSETRDVDRIFVIAPYPRVLRQGDVPPLRGVALAMHIVEMMMAERLFRDLREAEEVNRGLRALPEAAGDRADAVLDALGWTGRRVVEIVEVRPERVLSARMRSSP